MPGLVSVAQSKAVRATSLVLLAGVFAAACDTQEEADLDRGRDLFTKGCGTCHALAEARTGSDVGPDLDSSFAQARANGMDQDTIEGVVESQIATPRQAYEDDPDYENIYMPADIYTGSDAEDVAAYVASVAGVEGIKPPPLGAPPDLFTENCGNCHQLGAANTAGGVGPNLDEVLPGQDAEQITQSIQDPQADITEGFDEPSVMPPFDENAIPADKLAELVDYLIASTGGASEDVGSGAAGASGAEEDSGASGGKSRR